MLTWRDLEAAVDAKLLKRWPFGKGHPPFGGRALYVTPSVMTEMTERPWPSANGEHPNRTRDRRSAMRMVIERFVRGDALVVRMDLKELGSENVNSRMKGFWEIRSQGPVHETRLLGHFARPGAFVGTSFRSHELLNEFTEWEKQRDFCFGEWRRVFTAGDPLRTPWPVLTRDEYKQYTESSDE